MSQPPSLSLSAALARDVEKYGGDRDPKPLNLAVKSFIATISDKSVTEISRGDVFDWIDARRREGQAPATIKRRLAAIRAMVNRLFRDQEIDKKNPFEKHRPNRQIQFRGYEVRTAI